MGKTGGTTLEFVDYSISVNDFDAFDECRAVAAAGMLVGGSAGLNICAAKTVAAKCASEAPKEGGVCIVTLLCDHGIKYLSKISFDNFLWLSSFMESFFFLPSFFLWASSFLA